MKKPSWNSWRQRQPSLTIGIFFSLVFFVLALQKNAITSRDAGYMGQSVCAWWKYHFPLGHLVNSGLGYVFENLFVMKGFYVGLGLWLCWEIYYLIASETRLPRYVSFLLVFTNPFILFYASQTHPYLISVLPELICWRVYQSKNRIIFHLSFALMLLLLPQMFICGFVFLCLAWRDHRRVDFNIMLLLFTIFLGVFIFVTLGDFYSQIQTENLFLFAPELLLSHLPIFASVLLFGQLPFHWLEVSVLPIVCAAAIILISPKTKKNDLFLGMLFALSLVEVIGLVYVFYGRGSSPDLVVYFTYLIPGLIYLLALAFERVFRWKIKWGLLVLFLLVFHNGWVFFRIKEVNYKKIFSLMERNIPYTVLPCTSMRAFVVAQKNLNLNYPEPNGDFARAVIIVKEKTLNKDIYDPNAVIKDLQSRQHSKCSTTYQDETVTILMCEKEISKKSCEMEYQFDGKIPVKYLDNISQ